MLYQNFESMMVAIHINPVNFIAECAEHSKHAYAISQHVQTPEQLKQLYVKYPELALTLASHVDSAVRLSSCIDSLGILEKFLFKHEGLMIALCNDDALAGTVSNMMIVDEVYYYDTDDFDRHYYNAQQEAQQQRTAYFKLLKNWLAQYPDFSKALYADSQAANLLINLIENRETFEKCVQLNPKAMQVVLAHEAAAMRVLNWYQCAGLNKFIKATQTYPKVMAVLNQHPYIAAEIGEFFMEAAVQGNLQVAAPKPAVKIQPSAVVKMGSQKSTRVLAQLGTGASNKENTKPRTMETNSKTPSFARLTLSAERRQHRQPGEVREQGSMPIAPKH